MKILDAMWFCAGHGNVGIVQCMTDTGQVKYYVGQCNGWDEESDKVFISQLGSTFPTNAGDVLFGVDELRNGNAVPVPMNKEQAELMVRVGMLYLDQD